MTTPLTTSPSLNSHAKERNPPITSRRLISSIWQRPAELNQTFSSLKIALLLLISPIKAYSSCLSHNNSTMLIINTPATNNSKIQTPGIPPKKIFTIIQPHLSQMCQPLKRGRPGNCLQSMIIGTANFSPAINPQPSSSPVLRPNQIHISPVLNLHQRQPSHCSIISCGQSGIKIHTPLSGNNHLGRTTSTPTLRFLIMMVRLSSLPKRNTSTSTATTTSQSPI